jgi:hypothetical protein
VGEGDDDDPGAGLADARGVALAVVAGAVDPDDPHETVASAPSDPNIAAKKLPRWKRNRCSYSSALLRILRRVRLELGVVLLLIAHA